MSNEPNLHAARGNLDPLLSCREAAAVLAISVPTFWRRVADGTVPKPLKLGRVSRWPLSEILGTIDLAKARRTQLLGE